MKRRVSSPGKSHSHKWSSSDDSSGAFSTPRAISEPIAIPVPTTRGYAACDSSTRQWPDSFDVPLDLLNRDDHGMSLKMIPLGSSGDWQFPLLGSPLGGLDWTSWPPLPSQMSGVDSSPQHQPRAQQTLFEALGYDIDIDRQDAWAEHWSGQSSMIR